MRDHAIRQLGPGKFSTVLDQYVYGVSLDGCLDDDAGSDYGVFYGLMVDGHTIFKDHDPCLESLTTAEHDKLTDCAGVIVYEDGNGFVSVEYHDTRGELDVAWTEILALYGPDEDAD